MSQPLAQMGGRAGCVLRIRTDLQLYSQDVQNCTLLSLDVTRPGHQLRWADEPSAVDTLAQYLH